MSNENIVKDILEIAPANTHEIDGKIYSDKPLYHIPLAMEDKRAPDALTFSTIAGLIGVLKVEASNLIRDHKRLFIIIESPTKISVTTTFRDADVPSSVKRDAYLPYGERQALFTINAQTPAVQYGKFISYENMIIQLNAMFAPSDERDELLKDLSSISREDSEKIEDNGVSQNVVSRTGIQTKSYVTFKPIRELTPFRSFIEAEQAPSKFLVRINDRLEIGIFECDGGRWVVDAKSNIANYVSGMINSVLPEHSENIIVVI